MFVTMPCLLLKRSRNWNKYACSSVNLRLLLLFQWVSETLHFRFFSLLSIWRAFEGRLEWIDGRTNDGEAWRRRREKRFKVASKEEEWVRSTSVLEGEWRRFSFRPRVVKATSWRDNEVWIILQLMSIKMWNCEWIRKKKNKNSIMTSSSSYSLNCDIQRLTPETATI